MILKELLFHNHFHYVKFAEKLYVSDVTIQNDIKKVVRPFLAKYPLVLKKQGSEYTLCGNEREKRNLMSNLI